MKTLKISASCICDQLKYFKNYSSWLVQLGLCPRQFDRLIDYDDMNANLGGVINICERLEYVLLEVFVAYILMARDNQFVNSQN